MCMRQDSSCSWSIGCCSGFVGVLVSVFPERGDSLEAVSPPLSLPFFPLFFLWRVLVFLSFRMGAHGWVAWICQPFEQSPSRSWLPIVTVGTSHFQFCPKEAPIFINDLLDETVDAVMAALYANNTCPCHCQLFQNKFPLYSFIVLLIYLLI